MSKSLRGMSTSFLRLAGLVEGSLYRAKIHLEASHATPSDCRACSSSCLFACEVCSSATPLKTFTASRPPASLLVVTASELGSGKLCVESCTRKWSIAVCQAAHCSHARHDVITVYALHTGMTDLQPCHRERERELNITEPFSLADFMHADQVFKQQIARSLPAWSLKQIASSLRCL